MTTPEPIFDSVDTAVRSTIDAVKRGTYGGRTYRTHVPMETAKAAWEFYANDVRWDMSWETAADVAKERNVVSTDRYEGRDHIGVLA